MAVRKIVKMGHPQLMQPAREVVDLHDPQISSLLQDMQDSMLAYSGIGIAAPQIGYFVRVMMFGCDFNPRYPQMDPIPRTILINPTIEFLSQEMEEDWEGCLSVPGLRGLVPRFKHIRYQGYTETGHFLEREAEGFHARVVQHEYDHLDGILYPQRIKDMRCFGFEDELF